MNEQGEPLPRQFRKDFLVALKTVNLRSEALVAETQTGDTVSLTFSEHYAIPHFEVLETSQDGSTPRIIVGQVPEYEKVTVLRKALQEGTLVVTLIGFQ